MKNAVKYSIFAIAAAFAASFFSQAALADAKAPAPAAKSHNAYDYFVAAGKMARTTNQDAQVERAAGWTPEKDAPHTYTLAEKEAVLKTNEPPLTLVRQGFSYAFTPPPLSDPTQDGADQFPSYASFRGLARLLRFEAQVRAERGDWSGAVDSDLDAMQMGEMSAHGGGIITKLVSEAIVAIGRKGVWDAVPHMNAVEAKRAAERLAGIEQQREPLKLVARHEKAIGSLILGNMLKEMGKQEKLHGKRAFQEAGIDINNVQPAKLRRTQARLMDDAIALAARPYDPKAKDPAPDPSGLIFVSPTAKLKFRDTSSIAQNELLCATLSLQAYHEKFGNYPVSLNELTPSILAKTPIDPFAHDAPLRYRLQTHGYLLYSVGPDGKDDGGAPITNKAAKSADDRAKKYVIEDSRGDIVAGVNN